ncbi:hypothetical protein F5Y07DRAFT_396225 [Xylaria sp. FL0933]|nr:hypothetical protein F5Y07DRAFT_396225 [Xylaria sp. FL0933]
MAQMAMIHDAGAVSTLSGAAAGAVGANNRRAQAPYYRNQRVNPNAFDAASYMNHLRAPAPTRMPGDYGGGGGGVGIHIHYQGQCAHDVAQGPPYPGDRFAPYSEGYGSPQHSTYAGSPSSPCGCPRCYWRDFLASDVEKYKATCQQLRETYLWNLHELYYVGRVREVYDNHCEHHRLLFRDVCLMWELPERITLPEEDDDAVHSSRAMTPHSLHSSGGLRTPIMVSRGSTPLSRGSGGRLSVGPAEQMRKDKGKGKAVINTGLDGTVGRPAVESIHDDGMGKENKGKGNVINTGLDGDVDTPAAESVGDDNSGDNNCQDVETDTLPMITPSETTINPQAKPSKTSLHQRFRQLWFIRRRDKSSDKASLV